MPSLMFEFVDKRWNPIRVKYCPYDCYNGGCWATLLRKGRLKRVYDKANVLPQFIAKHDNFWKHSTVFVCTMCDIMHPIITDEMIIEVMNVIRRYARTDPQDPKPHPQFLLCSKNPQRYIALMLKYGDEFFPENVIFGITVESNRDYPKLSHAPELQVHRLMSAKILSDAGVRVFLSVEPVLEFDMGAFINAIRSIKPWGIAVGFDNYGNKLPEPTPERLALFVNALERDFKVTRKTLRRGDQDD